MLIKNGQPILLNNTFKVNGTLTDPTAITLVVTSPESNTATTYQWPSPADITKNSTGSFTIQIAANESGTWSYVWTGTGAAADVEDGTFDVFDVEPRRLYCTKDELKAVIFSGATPDTNDDFLLEMAIEGATDWIDQYCDTPVGFLPDLVDQSRTYEPSDLWHCDTDDLVSVTRLATDQDGDGIFETVWSASDYQLLPFNNVQHGQIVPYNQIHALSTRSFPWTYVGPTRRNLVQVTGKFGWPSLPPAVRNACLLLANAGYERRKSPAGIIGGFPDTGGMRVSLKLDPDVERLLAPYRSVRCWVG
jgi:hypothetical protein